MRMPSCKQHDRQMFFVETTQMSSSSTVQVDVSVILNGFDKTLFHGLLLKETDVMFSHGTFATATVITF